MCVADPAQLPTALSSSDIVTEHTERGVAGAGAASGWDIPACSDAATDLLINQVIFSPLPETECGLGKCWHKAARA